MNTTPWLIHDDSPIDETLGSITVGNLMPGMQALWSLPISSAPRWVDILDILEVPGKPDRTAVHFRTRGNKHTAIQPSQKRVRWRWKPEHA